jgi:hypothetical protein
MAYWCNHGWVCPGCLLLNIYYADPVNSIHERSAREKISRDQVAHVLNDEVSRKYIQSLKRYVPRTMICLLLSQLHILSGYSPFLKQNTHQRISLSSWVKAL